MSIMCEVKNLLLEVSKYMSPRDEINIWNREGQIEVQHCPYGNTPTNCILDNNVNEKCNCWYAVGNQDYCRSMCEDCGDCMQVVGQGNIDRCMSCEDRKQKEGKDYIDKRTIYQKYLELFIWKKI